MTPEIRGKIILPKSVMNMLGIDGSKTPLKMETDGSRIIIGPVRNKKRSDREHKVADAWAHTKRRYHNMFISLTDK